MEETGLDLPSIRACLRRALLNKNCGKNYTRTVTSFKLSDSSRALIEVSTNFNPNPNPNPSPTLTLPIALTLTLTLTLTRSTSCPTTST